jgi:hypothetical protein
MSAASNERILQESAIWNHNRRLYPGWLITPNEVRRRIWNYTETWIEPVVSVSSRLEADQSLWVLYELNWRLETSLLPMFDDVADAVEKVLLNWCRSTDDVNIMDRVELPIDVPDEPDATLRPDIRTMWKDLAFAVLRFHREERHHEAFSGWLARLTNAEPLSDDERSRLCHERALHALSNLDDGRALTALTDWPDNCRDPIWTVRKASLCAELGDLELAESLATEALSKFRHSTGQQSADIHNLSREAWTMFLLDNIAWARHFENQSRLRPQSPRGRWAQLSKFQCNPQTELEWFESRLDQPAPVTPPTVTRKAGFEPGEYGTTYHGGDQGLWGKLSVAYQFMRLSEEAPCPPAVGNVVLSGKRLRQAAEWFIEHDPVRTRTLALRLRDKELTHNYLSRHRIAALSGNLLEELHQLAVRSLDEALPKLTGSEPRSDPAAERKRRRLSTSIDLLARTVIRASIEEGLKLWDRALLLYESPVVRFDFNAPEALFRLFRGLMGLLPDDELASRFRQIVELPIPETKSFRVLNSLTWPDLTRYFEHRLPSLSAGVVGEDWTGVTETLLQAARDEKPGVRRRAIVRLAALFRYGCLCDSASKKLADAYWSQLTPEGLPNVERFLPWTCLNLPEPEPSVSVERFRAYACKSRAESSIDIDLLHDWIGATRIADESPGKHQRFVDWTSHEIRGMVAQMKDWWDQLDIAAEKRRENDRSGVWMWPSGQISYRKFVSEMVDVLRQVVIPRIQNDPETIGVIANLVDDFAKHGLPVAAVLPAMQTLQPDRDIAREIRRALASHEPDVYSSALKGLVHWLQLRRPGRKSSAGTTLPELPADLLRELGMVVATRRPAGLLEALDTVAWMLQTYPDVVDSHFLDSIVVTLEYLWVETKYRSFGSDSDRIPYTDVPRYRERAARIASLLRQTPVAERETVHQWITAASDDPLPEVRRVTRNIAAEEAELARPVTVDELIDLIEESIPDRISSEEKETLFASVTPLLQRAEFASSQGIVPLEEQLQLASLLVVRISQTLSSGKAARSAIKAMISRIVTSPRHLSRAKSAELHGIAVRDDLTQPDETLIWLREWTSRTENRGKKASRSRKNEASGAP